MRRRPRHQRQTLRAVIRDYAARYPGASDGAIALALGCSRCAVMEAFGWRAPSRRRVRGEGVA